MRLRDSRFGDNGFLSVPSRHAWNWIELSLASVHKSLRLAGLCKELGIALDRGLVWRGVLLATPAVPIADQLPFTGHPGVASNASPTSSAPTGSSLARYPGRRYRWTAVAAKE
jgi:hypothetical protein